jgi:hypothetical protein
MGLKIKNVSFHRLQRTIKFGYTQIVIVIMKILIRLQYINFQQTLMKKMEVDNFCMRVNGFFSVFIIFHFLIQPILKALSEKSEVIRYRNSVRF